MIIAFQTRAPSLRPDTLQKQHTDSIAQVSPGPNYWKWCLYMYFKFIESV